MRRSPALNPPVCATGFNPRFLDLQLGQNLLALESSGNILGFVKEAVNIEMWPAYALNHPSMKSHNNADGMIQHGQP